MINIKTIAESGQCFRLNKVGWNKYELVVKGKVINIYDDDRGSFIFYPVYNWAFDYFNVDSNTEIKNPDPFLAKAIEHSHGLVLLSPNVRAFQLLKIVLNDYVELTGLLLTIHIMLFLRQNN